VRKDFPGWVPPEQATLDRYWREATFAVDTSVLLDLYRFSADAREGLLAALRSFGDRLWIPHQVALEFHRNRFGVLLAQRDAEEKLLNELEGIQRELDGQLSQLLRGAGRRDLDPLRDAITESFEALRASLQKAEQAHTEGLGKSVQEDPIYEEVESLFADRVGQPFAEADLAAVIEDAKARISDERPPGYLDDGKSGDARYGDVIVWHQLCVMAERKKLPVVLVADDRKADWVWEERGKTLGPRPELVAEMRKKAEVGFYLYTPSRLFELWKDRQGGEDERSEILEEIRSPSLIEAPKSIFAERPPGPRFTAKGTVESFRKGSRMAPTSPRLVDSAMSSLEFDDGEWVLSLQFVPNEIDGQTPGVRARVDDDRGNSAVVDYPIGMGVPGRLRTLVLRYPLNFLGAHDLLPGRYSVEWSAFSHQRHQGAVIGEIREDLARDAFYTLPRPGESEGIRTSD
jgi:hypothetical protein